LPPKHDNEKPRAKGFARLERVRCPNKCEDGYIPAAPGKRRVRCTLCRDGFVVRPKSTS
jgi:hypothetical protein